MFSERLPALLLDAARGVTERHVDVHTAAFAVTQLAGTRLEHRLANVIRTLRTDAARTHTKLYNAGKLRSFLAAALVGQ